MRPDRVARKVISHFRKVHRRPWRRQKTEHWKDMDELHKVLHELPDHLKAVILELLERPTSRRERGGVDIFKK